MTYDIGTARGVIEMDYNGRGIKQAQAELTGLEKAGLGVSKGMSLAMGAVAGIGLSVAGAFAFAIKKTSEFEHQMSAIEAVSGATADEMDAIREKALQLGADTAFTATEAAQAMEELVKAGLSVEEVLGGAADAAVALAAAGGISIPEAATIASNAMNQFNLVATDLTGVVDSIAGAANASAIDVSQLGQSLSQVGAVANLAGLSFEDTATAIALMGNAGIVGSDAGTSLKTMLQNLNPVTEKQINLFEELGILTKDGANRFFDAEGNVKSYAQISGVLSKALEGMGNQQKLATLETMFGTDAIRAAAVAADAGAKGVRQLNDEMNKTSAAEVAAKRMDNFKGSLDQLWGSIESGVVKGTSGLLVYLRDLVDWLTQTVNSAVDAGEALSDRLGPGFNDLFEAIGHVLSIVMEIIDIFDDLAVSLGKLGLGVIIGLFTVLASVLETVTGALEGQEEIILIVLGAWLLLANGGIAVVAAKLGWFAAYAVVQALNGLVALETGARGATTALTALAASAATAAASLGAVVLLVAAVTAWNNYKKAVEETDAALQGAQKAKESGNFQALQTEIDKINELAAKRRKALEDLGAAPGERADTGDFFLHWINPANWGDTGEVYEWKDSLSVLDEQTAELAATMEGMGRGVTDLATRFGLLDPSEAEALVEAFNEGDPEALARMDELLADMQPLLDKAGISATEFLNALKGDGDMTLPDVRAALDNVTSKAYQARNATKSLSEAARTFGDEALTAAEKADALTQAMDDLIGVNLDADQAAIAWRDGLRTLRAEIDRTGEALFAHTKLGDANRALVISSVEDLKARIAAEAKAGTSIGKLTNLFKTSRKELIDNVAVTKAQREEMMDLLDAYNLNPRSVRTLVEAAGVVRAKSQVEKLIDQYNLSPDQVKTIFEATGADTAKEKVRALRDAIKEIRGKNAPMAVPGTPEAEDQVKDLKKAIDALTGKDAPIDAPGAAFARDQVAALREEIARLTDKSVTITYVKRTVNSGLGPVDDSYGGAGSSGGGGGSGGDGSSGRKVAPQDLTSGMLPSTPTTPSEPSAASLPSPKSATRGGATARERLIDGELRLDPSGRAFITGVAVAADDDDDDYEDTLQRMGRR